MRAEGGVSELLPRQRRRDISAEPASETEGVAEESIEPGDDLLNPLVRVPQGSGRHRLPHGNPRRAHVLQLQRSRPRVLEVPDELPQYPGLVRVGDATVFLVYNGFR